MKATQLLSNLGQSIWLDNITRQLASILPADGGDCEQVLAQFEKEGIDMEELANRLQEDGAKSFAKSWSGLMDVIASKSAVLKKAS